MARGATVYTFEIALSDIDRGVYDTVPITAAQHPSESGAYLVARVLAYALEFREGLEYSGGLASSSDPACWVHDLTGQLMAWIEVGTPDADRLHKAAKSADRVAVYCHKDRGGWLASLAAAKVHGTDRIALHGLPWKIIGEIAGQLERRNKWALTRMEGMIYLESGDTSWSFPLEPLPWPTS